MDEQKQKKKTTMNKIMSDIVLYVIESKKHSLFVHFDGIL